MNSQFLIRIAAAALAATTLLTAQSAPIARTKAGESKAEAVSTERLQVRLAEVIAMLEEDDLTAEQRDQARKKLQEISAKLKSASAKSSSAIAVAPSAALDVHEVHGKVAAVAPSAAHQVQTVTVDGKKVAFVHESSKSDHAIEVVPVEGKAHTFTRKSAASDEPRTLDIVVAPEAAQDPAPAKPPKPTKAPKAPKAPKAAKAAPEPVEAPAERELVEVEKARSGPLRLRRATAEGSKEEAVRTLRTDVETLNKRIAEVKAAQEEGAKPRVLRVRQLEGEGQGQEGTVREHRELLEFARRAADEGALAKAHALRSGQLAERVRDHAEAVKRYAKLEAEAKAQGESEAAADKAVAAKLYRSRADAAKKDQGEAKSRARAAKAEDEAKAEESVRALFLDRVRRTHDVDDGDDDREIRKLIDEMRAEMRQIRALLQDLRKQAQAPRGRTPGQDRAPASSASGSGGSVALGRSGASAFGGAVGAGAGTREPGQSLFGSSGSGTARGSWNLLVPGQSKQAPGSALHFPGGSGVAGPAQSAGEPETTATSPEPFKRSAGSRLLLR